MRIDTEALTHKQRKDALDVHVCAAERLGIQAAFRDIEKLGFAFAYRQTEVDDGIMWKSAQACRFHASYKQAVFGWWMAMGE
jgi:hypothetical protein